jgi:DNA-binding beta-propeller fold protein YncE
MRPPLSRTLTVALAVAAAACTTAPPVLQFGTASADAAQVWPLPATQEKARYRYVGELTGETNFKPADNSGVGVRDVFRWIVGLVEGPVDPLVLQRPQSGAVDNEGRIYVTDISRKAVFVFDQAKGELNVWEEVANNRAFLSPIGVAMGEGGDVLVTDSEHRRVFRFDRNGKPKGDFGAGVLLRPTGIARDAAGKRIFVADTYAHDIKVFDDAGQLIDTLGRRGDAPGEFNFPTHVTYARNTLYVTDMLNSRIQGFTADGEAALRFGQAGLYVGNLARPKGVATDSEGNIYVIESMYDTLLVFDRSGRFLLPIGGTGKEAGKFFLPAGVWSDNRDRIYVADMFNGRIVVFQFLGGS